MACLFLQVKVHTRDDYNVFEVDFVYGGNLFDIKERHDSVSLIVESD